MKILFMLFIIGLTSCTNAEQPAFNQEKVLNLKNATRSDIKMLMVNKGDTFSILLSSNSLFELIGLKDSCNSFEQTLKNKIEYLSYQKGGNRARVLIDRKNSICITDLDVIKKSKADFTYANRNGKAGFERVVVYFPLE